MIAVDIDDVLFPFVPEFVQFDNARFNGSLSEDDFFNYRFWEVLGIPLDEAVERVYDFNAAEHSHIEPLYNVKDSLKALSKDYDLVVITARHPRFADVTDNWLNTHLEGIFSEVVHIGHALVVDEPQRKVDVCHKLKAFALIDDSLDHTSECVDEGIEGILFGNYPWNQSDKLPKGVSRCEDWPAVEEYFNGRG